MSTQQTGDNSNNLSGELKTFKKGERLGATKLNQSVNIINKINRTLSGSKNQTLLRSIPKLYIATETKGIWDSGASSDNGVITVRPIRMIQYNQDGLNDDVIGDEITLPKFWGQHIDEDDLGIGVDMGNGVTGFYSIAGVGTIDDVPYLYDCDCSVVDTETWKRGDPDTDNPDNAGTGNPVIGFEVKIVTDVCYDPTIGKFTKTHRTFSFDSKGMLLEMSAETEADITTTAGCT